MKKNTREWIDKEVERLEKEIEGEKSKNIEPDPAPDELRDALRDADTGNQDSSTGKL